MVYRKFDPLQANMKKLVFFITCLACMCFGRRITTHKKEVVPNPESFSRVNVRRARHPNSESLPSKALAMFLAVSSPASSFHLVTPCAPVTSQSLRSRCVTMTSLGGIEMKASSNSTKPGRWLTKPTMARCLSVLGGFTDILIFRKFKCYANMHTGTSLKLVQGAAYGRSIDMIFYASMVMSYMIGFTIYRIVEQVLVYNVPEVDSDDANRNFTPVILAPFIFASFALFDFLCHRFPLGTACRWFLPLVAAGSALINAAALDLTGTVTVMLTGHLQMISTYVSNVFVNVLFNGKKPSRVKALESASIILSFALGAGLSYAYGFQPALKRLPVFALLGFAYALLLATFSSPPGIRPRRLIAAVLFKGPLQEDVGDLGKNQTESILPEESVIGQDDADDTSPEDEEESKRQEEEERKRQELAAAAAAATVAAEQLAAVAASVNETVLAAEPTETEEDLAEDTIPGGEEVVKMQGLETSETGEDEAEDTIAEDEDVVTMEEIVPPETGEQEAPAENADPANNTPAIAD